MADVANPAPTTDGQTGTQQIAWGAKVDDNFKARVCSLCADLGMNHDYLMAAMAFESGETFSPSIQNKGGSGATGLIQFMAKTAASLGTSLQELAAMTAVQQLDYVEKYFQPHKGRLQTLEDHYMAIIWPAAIGKPDDYVLFSSPSTDYQQNRGLDADNDGKITKAEAAAKVRAKYQKGLGTGFAG